MNFVVLSMLDPQHVRMSALCQKRTCILFEISNRSISPAAPGIVASDGLSWVSALVIGFALVQPYQHCIVRAFFAPVSPLSDYTPRRAREPSVRIVVLSDAVSKL
jgi:hypothetical protein